MPCLNKLVLIDIELYSFKSVSKHKNIAFNALRAILAAMIYVLKLKHKNTLFRNITVCICFVSCAEYAGNKKVYETTDVNWDEFVNFNRRPYAFTVI